jgi:protein phosphatase
MFDIVGDVHSCYIEFKTLLEKLGYVYTYNSYQHPEGRKVVLVGDIMDRGNYPVATFCLVRDMFEAGNLLSVIGNHDDKILRWAKGNGVKLNNGADKTVNDFESISFSKEEIIKFFEGLPYYLLLDNNKLIIAHAAWQERNIYTDPFDNKKLRSSCLYGPVTGERDHYNLPVRINWAGKRILKEDSPIIVYGHQVHEEPYIINKTYCIDTGCIFGGYLTALRYPEMELVQTKALMEYYEWIGKGERR